MRIVPNSKYTKIARSEDSEINRSLWLAGMKCAEITTCCKAKYLIAQILERKIFKLEVEVKLILARLQINKNVGSLPGFTGWKPHT